MAAVRNERGDVKIRATEIKAGMTWLCGSKSDNLKTHHLQNCIMKKQDIRTDQ
jgi:hypothetical protein